MLCESYAARTPPGPQLRLGLIHFIHADPARPAGFDKILATTGETQKPPDAEELAKGLGDDSPGALITAWQTDMVSDAFQ